MSLFECQVPETQSTALEGGEGWGWGSGWGWGQLGRWGGTACNLESACRLLAGRLLASCGLSACVCVRNELNFELRISTLNFVATSYIKLKR